MNLQNSLPAKPRAVLTRSDVITIFQSKATLSSATKVARLYGVNEKTIRDIWTARTWAAETWHLDTSRAPKVKTAGRPLGCRDSKPRKQNQAAKHCRSSMAWDRADRRATNSSDSATSRRDTALTYENFTYDCLLGGKCTDIFLWNQGDVHQVHGSEHSCSLDDHLFDWEQGMDADNGHLSDPFGIDWSQ